MMETRAPQKRRIATRQKLIDAAKEIVATQGFAALRIEDIVARAKVAKGTFFSHFDDKDRLMALLIGEEMDRILRETAATKTPETIPDIARAITPLLEYIGQDRIVFDVVIRFSGATAIETTELISVNFGDQVALFTGWIAQMDKVRKDVDPVLLAEGIQAFATQAIALKFCALHNSLSVTERLLPYLQAWLAPVRSAQ